MRKKLSDYTGNNTIVMNMPDYIGQALADKVTELEVNPGQLCCMNSFFNLPTNWDFVLWGIKIIIIKNYGR